MLSLAVLGSLAGLLVACVEDDRDSDPALLASADDPEAALDEVAPDDPALPGVQAKTISVEAAPGFTETGPVSTAVYDAAECSKYSKRCVAVVLGTALACGSALASGGANIIADASCSLALINVSTGTIQDNCDLAANFCRFGTYNGATTASGFVGSTQGTTRSQDLTCGSVANGRSYERVGSLNVWGATPSGGSLLISHLQFICTNGLTLNFSGAPDTSLGGNGCGTGKLIQGVDVYSSGSAINKIRTSCDPPADSTTADTKGTWRGTTSGGTLRSAACPEGYYMFGAHVEYRTQGGKEIINGFNLICKQ